jgi:cytochrome c553
MMTRLIALTMLALCTGPALALDMGAADIVAMRCGNCHGANGQATSPIYPSLAGQNADYIRKQLREFVSGQRVNETMSPQAKDLSPENIDALAVFFAEKPPRISRVTNNRVLAIGRKIFFEGSPENGLPACAICHGDDAHGSATLPRLAGQNARYIMGQLQDFSLRARNVESAAMHRIAAQLDDDLFKAVADYLSQLP